jgi:hypothetical protein
MLLNWLVPLYKELRQTIQPLPIMLLNPVTITTTTEVVSRTIRIGVLLVKGAAGCLG